MVSITSKKNVKVFFRGEDEVVIQHAGREFSVKMGVNMEIKCTGNLLIEAGSLELKTTTGKTTIQSAGDLELIAQGVGENEQANVHVQSRSGGMYLNSQNDLNIDSEAALNLHSKTESKVASKGDTRIAGRTVSAVSEDKTTLNAGTTLSAKAAMTAELEGAGRAELKGGAETVIKGAIVRIN